MNRNGFGLPNIKDYKKMIMKRSFVFFSYPEPTLFIES